jgi:HK97 family phage major capsid protein
MKALSDKAEAEGRDLTADEYEQYGKLESDLDAKDTHAKRLQREAGIESNMTRDVALPEAVPAPVDRTVSEVAEVRARAERGDKQAQREYIASDEYRDAFVAGMKARSLGDLDAESRAALNVGTGAQGGFLVPAEFQRQLVESERFYGTIRQLSTVIVTADNGALSIPKVDDANRMVATWTAEAAAFTESEDQFLQATLGSFKQGTISKLSDELILDSAFDILGFVARSAGQALGLLANTAYAVGASGSTTTPEGLLVKSSIGRTMPTGNSTSITSADELIELYHSVRPAYRPRGTWVFSDTAIKQVRQLKTSQGVYLWQPSLTTGDPDTILGRPVVADPDVAVPAANALCGGFGDVKSAYWIRDVQDVTVKILNELYAANGQVGYRTHRRTDGDVIDTLAFKTLKNSAT